LVVIQIVKVQVEMESKIIKLENKNKGDSKMKNQRRKIRAEEKV